MIGYLSAHDLLKEGRVVLGVEGRVAGEEDVRDDADAPHVDRLVIRLAHQNLKIRKINGKVQMEKLKRKKGKDQDKDEKESNSNSTDQFRYR